MNAEGLWDGQGVGTCNEPSDIFYFHDAGNDSTVRAVDLRARYGAPYYTVRRGDVSAALLKTLPGNGPKYGKGVASVVESDDGTTRLKFADGSTSSPFDVVVAADGIASSLRSYVLDGASLPQQESAIVNIIGIFPKAELNAGAEPVGSMVVARALEARAGFTVHLDPAMTLILSTVTPTHVMWSVAVNAALLPRGCDDSDEALRAFLTKHESEPPPSAFVKAAIAACVAHTPRAPHEDAVYLWRLRDTGPAPTFVRGRVALIGDAAHPALPWTGLGISAAALDAQRLADALAVPGVAVADALAAYDADRRPVDHAVQQAARASDGGQGPSAYNTGRVALRLVPLKLMYGVQDKLVKDAGGEVNAGWGCAVA